MKGLIYFHTKQNWTQDEHEQLEKLKMLKAKTKRFKQSALPYMRRLKINEHDMKAQVMKSL